MDTFYVLHPIFAQITEQNPAEQVIKLLGFVQRVVPETNIQERKTEQKCCHLASMSSLCLITASVLSLTTTLLMLSFKIYLGRLIQNPKRD